MSFAFYSKWYYLQEIKLNVALNKSISQIEKKQQNIEISAIHHISLQILDQIDAYWINYTYDYLIIRFEKYVKQCNYVYNGQLNILLLNMNEKQGMNPQNYLKQQQRLVTHLLLSNFTVVLQFSMSASDSLWISK